MPPASASFLRRPLLCLLFIRSPTRENCLGSAAFRERRAQKKTGAALASWSALATEKSHYFSPTSEYSLVGRGRDELVQINQPLVFPRTIVNLSRGMPQSIFH